jgi:hypothetical protein
MKRLRGDFGMTGGIKQPVRFQGSLVISLVIILLMSTLASCNEDAFVAVAPPYLPAQYYDCVEVTPLDLVNSYFSGYANASHAEVEYNDRYFVFKNIPVREWVIADLDQGWIWAGSGIKCLLVNPGDMKRFKLEDKIDIVGFNTGVITYQTPGLLFKDCYAMAAGSVQLPAGGSAGFTPAY